MWAGLTTGTCRSNLWCRRPSLDASAGDDVPRISFCIQPLSVSVAACGTNRSTHPRHELYRRVLTRRRWDCPLQLPGAEMDRFDRCEGSTHRGGRPVDVVRPPHTPQVSDVSQDHDPLAVAVRIIHRRSRSQITGRLCLYARCARWGDGDRRCTWLGDGRGGCVYVTVCGGSGGCDACNVIIAYPSTPRREARRAIGCAGRHPAMTQRRSAQA